MLRNGREGRRGFLTSPKYGHMGPLAKGGSQKSNAGARFHREVNARLTVRCQNLEEDIADLRNRLKAQQMRIHHIEGLNDDLELEKDQWDQKEKKYSALKGEFYLTKEQLENQRKKNAHLENALAQAKQSHCAASLHDLLKMDTNVENVTKDIFTALREKNTEKVNDIVVDQLRGLSRVRKELGNQKELNKSLMAMREHDRKVRKDNDRDILEIYTKAKHDKARRTNDLKTRDETIARLRRQVDDVTEQRDLMRARLNTSGKNLSIGEILKKKMPFQKLLNSSDITSRLSKRFADKKKTRRRRKPVGKNQGEIALPPIRVTSGSPVKGMTSPVA